MAGDARSGLKPILHKSSFLVLWEAKWLGMPVRV